MTGEELREKLESALETVLASSGVDFWKECAVVDDLAEAALRVVAEAMREPSKEMVAAGIGYLPKDPFNSGAAHHWRAMLAASPLAEAVRDE
jgi:hypothetical protein